jgi:NAD(P)-dependent dehydrogenase (short-subunit alcohol dehydrogenase family)
MATADVSLLKHPPLIRFDDRVVWITGASRGLGRALAFGFAGAGASLMLSARSEEPLHEVAETIRERGGKVEVVVGSVTDPGSIGAAVAGIERTWGQLDALINNAGISPVFKRSELVDDDEWRAVLDTNLTAPFACCRAALPLLANTAGASVVNVSSVHGQRAHERLVAYAASKGGLEMLTRTLAVEWAARGVRINAVAPGYLETDMTAGLRDHPKWNAALLRRIPMDRFGTTAEVVACIMFLASPLAGYVTGATLFVDGGWAAQ